MMQFCMALATFLALGGWWHDRKPITDAIRGVFNRQPYSDAVTIVLSLLRDRPEEWTSDRYHATHSTGVSMWIAGKALMLDLNVAGQKAGFTNSLDLPLTQAEKSVLWNAWQKAKDCRTRKSTNTQVAAFAKRVIDRYEAEKAGEAVDKRQIWDASAQEAAIMTEAGWKRSPTGWVRPDPVVEPAPIPGVHVSSEPIHGTHNTMFGKAVTAEGIRLGYIKAAPVPPPPVFTPANGTKHWGDLS